MVINLEFGKSGKELTCTFNIYSNRENYISKPMTRDAKRRIRNSKMDEIDWHSRRGEERRGEMDPELSGYISVGGFSGTGSLWDYFLNREPGGWKRDLRDDADYFISLHDVTNTLV